jgi:hypothetical protein
MQPGLAHEVGKEVQIDADIELIKVVEPEKAAA